MQAKSRGKSRADLGNTLTYVLHPKPDFTFFLLSGTLKETSPIHLDLFEVIKAAIVSGEGGEGKEDLEVEEPEEADIKMPTDIEVTESASGVILSQVEGILRQVVTSFLSLPQSQQLLLGIVVLYFVAKLIFGKKTDAAEAFDDLTRKVDDLTLEVKEMKAMLETILKQSEENKNEL